jgi:hypothetical protein
MVQRTIRFLLGVVSSLSMFTTAAHAVEELAAVVLPAYEGERDWATAVRAGLGALLEFLDGEPALRRLVFVEALGAGPRVLELRVQVLRVLQGAVEKGRRIAENIRAQTSHEGIAA